MVTEREAVLRERAAFRSGWIEATLEMRPELSRFGISDVASDVAMKRYPLPKQKRPRVVKDPHGDAEWSVQGGRLMWRKVFLHPTKWWAVEDESELRPNHIAWLTPERIKLWADLLQHPEEEVEE